MHTILTVYILGIGSLVSVSCPIDNIDFIAGGRQCYIYLYSLTCISVFLTVEVIEEESNNNLKKDHQLFSKQLFINNIVAILP